MFWEIGYRGTPIILAVHVAGFVMAAPGHEDEWDSIKSVIRTTKPDKVGRVLRVHRTFTKLGKTKHLTTVDTTGSVKSCVGIYNKMAC